MSQLQTPSTWKILPYQLRLQSGISNSASSPQTPPTPSVTLICTPYPRPDPASTTLGGRASTSGQISSRVASLSFSHLSCQVRSDQVLEHPQLYDPAAPSRRLNHLPRASRFGLGPTQLRPGAEPRVAIGWSPARRGARIGWVEAPARRQETPDWPSLSLLPGPFKGFRLARGRGHVSRVERGEDVRTVSFNSATALAPKSSALLSGILLYQVRTPVGPGGGGAAWHAPPHPAFRAGGAEPLAEAAPPAFRGRTLRGGG